MPDSMFRKRKDRPTGGRPRLTTPIPLSNFQNWNFDAVAGPVFTVPVEAAVLRNKKGWPLQQICGGAYPFLKQFQTLQPNPVFAPYANSIVGIGLQLGQFATAIPVTDEYGQFQNESEDSF